MLNLSVATREEGRQEILNRAFHPFTFTQSQILICEEKENKLEGGKTFIVMNSSFSNNEWRTGRYDTWQKSTTEVPYRPWPRMMLSFQFLLSESSDAPSISFTHSEATLDDVSFEFSFCFKLIRCFPFGFPSWMRFLEKKKKNCLSSESDFISIFNLLPHPFSSSSWKEAKGKDLRWLRVHVPCN